MNERSRQIESRLEVPMEGIVDDAEMLERLGETVGDARRNGSFTVEAVANKAGVDPSRLRGIEAGELEPTIVEFVRVAHAMNLDPGDLASEAFGV